MSTNEVTNQNRKLKVSQSAELSTKPPDSKPKVQAKPSIPSHTQSHANLQKEIRHTKVSSHENTRVERSARNQVQPHKLDLWHNTEYLFGPLPSANDFEQAFSEMNLIQTLKDQPKVTCTEHWSNKFKDFVKKHKNMQPPPDPQIPFKQNSRFWEKNTVNFQVEECQRKKLSSLHHLLSAFVIIEEKEGENQENREKTTENRAGERLDNGEFQPGAHALIPRVKCENYYGFSFEERLEFELESLGLTVSDQRQIAPFDSEINFRLNQISLIEPKLDQYKKDILKNLEKFKRKREERIRNYQKSQEYLDSVLGNEC
ncbi:hypothetical protein GPJ56_006429 [Histomonas meleagridis]|uniref:uncharacterized protein n=1 Tax=Histomonas meleagridis TaxID=135588 RepID=UPI00355973DE|nr:hypothetical protein GPJ56_006429 [Histomonas meleagridis]KAH0796755.1 hypothetical protein GO595_010648 [Histomonas meleagridis]